jgi:ABC-type uncharacterized transport system ATPase subunit
MGLVEALCGRVFMIARGRSVLYGDLQAIKREYSADAIRVRSNAAYQTCPLVERIETPSDTDRTALVHLRAPATADQFLAWLVAERADVDCFERLSTPLEDIFVHLAEHADRVHSAGSPGTSSTPGTPSTL